MRLSERYTVGKFTLDLSKEPGKQAHAQLKYDSGDDDVTLFSGFATNLSDVTSQLSGLAEKAVKFDALDVPRL